MIFVQPTSPLSIVDYVFFMVILALMLGTMFVGQVKGVLDRFVAGGFLVFHSFPALAWFLEPGLYLMFVPAGIFTLLCSPSNLLFAVPQTRWLLWGVLPSSATLAVFGFLLFLSGIAIFVVARARGRKLVTSGLYSVVRHPQYLGMILAALGLTLLERDSYSGTKLISLIAWTLLIVAYVWLA